MLDSVRERFEANVQDVIQGTNQSAARAAVALGHARHNPVKKTAKTIAMIMGTICSHMFPQAIHIHLVCKTMSSSKQFTIVPELEGKYSKRKSGSVSLRVRVVGARERRRRNCVGV